jgi:hypothetical protein
MGVERWDTVLILPFKKAQTYGAPLALSEGPLRTRFLKGKAPTLPPLNNSETHTLKSLTHL